MSALKKLLMLVAFCFPLVASAQSHLVGNWNISMTPPGGGAMEMAVKIELTDADSLAMAIVDPNGGELPLLEESLVDNKLHFLIATGHGDVTCDLFHKDNDYYAGLCTGAMGEGQTTLKRVVDEAHGGSGHQDGGHDGNTPRKP